MGKKTLCHNQPIGLLPRRPSAICHERQKYNKQRKAPSRPAESFCRAAPFLEGGLWLRIIIWKRLTGKRESR